jgi:hypothetical protein
MEKKMADRIRVLAREDGRDFSSYVRMVLKNHLAQTTRRPSESGSVAQKGTK